jgi:hypothetical protein
VTANEDSVTLTRQQLRNFAQAIQNSTIEKVKNEVENISFYIEDEITIELNGLELEVNVDTDAVLNNIAQKIDYGEYITDEDVQTYLNDLEK